MFVFIQVLFYIDSWRRNRDRVDGLAENIHRDNEKNIYSMMEKLKKLK